MRENNVALASRNIDGDDIVDEDDDDDYEVFAVAATHSCLVEDLSRSR